MLINPWLCPLRRDKALQLAAGGVKCRYYASELNGEPALNGVVSGAQNNRFLTTLAGGDIALRKEVLELRHGINVDR